jgi:hypothetical protein
MDELVSFSTKGEKRFNGELVSHIYDATAHGNPLRKFARDECVYEMPSGSYMELHLENAHPDFTRDVMVEFLRLRDCNRDEQVRNVYVLHDKHRRFVDTCHYHQHNDSHLHCVPEPEEEHGPSTGRR